MDENINAFSGLAKTIRSNINISGKAEAGISYLDVESHLGMLTDCFWPPWMPRRKS